MTTSSRSAFAVRFAAAVVVTLMWSTCLAGAAGAGPVPTRAPKAGNSPAKVTAGVLDTLFIPVYGTDQSAGSESVASMQGAMNTVDQYYNAVSRGATRVNTTVMNWLQIPDTLMDDCGHNDLGIIDDLAFTAAQQAGQNLNGYDRVIAFAHQSPTCTWGGGRSSMMPAPGTSYLPMAVNHLESYTITHELGHTLGLFHVHDMSCDTVFSGHCDSDEYGGRFDPMGSTWPTALSFSAPHLDMLGMLPAAEVTTVTGNGTFTLGPLATAAPGTKRVLRIPSAAGGRTYTLEYRTAAGVDAPLGSPVFAGWQPGVILHGVIDYGNGPGVYQFDGTPDSQANDLADGALPVGATVTDPGGLRITVTSQGPAGATVSVQGFLTSATIPTVSSVSFTDPNNTTAANVQVRWPNSWVAPDVASVKVETSPQIGQPVTVAAEDGLADVAMPTTPGCVRYRIRVVTTNGTVGPPSYWSAPRCFFGEIQPGSLAFRPALRKASPAGAGTTAISSTVDPTWGETNHYLPGAFAGYPFELSVQGRPVVNGTTAGTVVQTGFAPAAYPVPVNTIRAGSMVLSPRPGDAITTEMHFTFNGSLQVPITSVPEGLSLHNATIPASPHLQSTMVRRLTPEEVVATGCAAATAADVAMVPFTVPTPFPTGVFSTIAVTSPNVQGVQVVSMTVKGNLATQPDRCLLWMDEGFNEPLTVRLIRIADDDGVPPPPPGGSTG